MMIIKRIVENGAGRPREIKILEEAFMYSTGSTNGRRRDVFDDIFADFSTIVGGLPVNQRQVQRAFPIDVEERPDSYLIRADVPGVAKENIEASMEGNILTISVKSSCENKAEVKPEVETQYLHRERCAYSATRELELPLSTGQSISASLKDGVLTIEVKKDEQKRPRRIEIA
jgi:HSP20 family protein